MGILGNILTPRGLCCSKAFDSASFSVITATLESSHHICRTILFHHQSGITNPMRLVRNILRRLIAFVLLEGTWAIVAGIALMRKVGGARRVA